MEVGSSGGCHIKGGTCPNLRTVHFVDCSTLPPFKPPPGGSWPPPEGSQPPGGWRTRRG